MNPMRYLIGLFVAVGLISVGTALFITGPDQKDLSVTGPTLEVGDCGTISSRNPSEAERWEKKGIEYLFRVIELGKHKYRVYMVSLEYKVGFESSVSYKNFVEHPDMYSKIDCNEAERILAQ